MVKEIKGDLIKLAKEKKFDLIAHGCNCQKVMGAGIAKQIAKNFPSAYSADKKDQRLPIERLGDFTIGGFNSITTLYILNLYTQFLPGKNLDYEALTLCLRKVNMLFYNRSIGLPQIGAGIAGGDWNRIKEIIKTELKDMDVTIVYYEP